MDEILKLIDKMTDLATKQGETIQIISEKLLALEKKVKEMEASGQN